MSHAVDDLAPEVVKERLAYDPETGELRWKYSVARRVKAGDVTGYRARTGYLIVTVNNRGYLAHRLAWVIQYGKWPENELDHINGDRADNRLENLREVSRSENNQNQRKAWRSSRSGMLGVQFHKASQKFIARIQRDKQRYHLGVFDTPEAAYSAYVQAKRQLHPAGML